MSLCRLRVLAVGLLLLCLVHGFDLVDLSFTRTLAFAGAWACSVWLWNRQIAEINWTPLKRFFKFIAFLVVVWTALATALFAGEIVWKRWRGSSPTKRLGTNDLYPMLFYYELWLSTLNESDRDKILLLTKEFESDSNCKDGIAEFQRVAILKSLHGEELNSLGVEQAQALTEKKFALPSCATAKDFCDVIRAKIQARLKEPWETESTKSKIEASSKK